jgi:hypothetical protein
MITEEHENNIASLVWYEDIKTDDAELLEADRDRWRRVAEHLAKDKGNVNEAYALYRLLNCP